MIREFLAAAPAFSIPPAIARVAAAALEDVRDAWALRDGNAARVTAKVMLAFREAGITDAHLQGTTGYGYHDFAREAYERILARAMDADAALARVQLATGTQAIVTAMTALAGRSGGACMLTGRPYDTLRLALADHARPAFAPEAYAEVPWRAGGAIDIEAVRRAMARKPAVAFIQRSRGYASRTSIDVATVGTLIGIVRDCSDATFVVVDNCYGELVEETEPCSVGADVVVGSLIKNPGGGTAPAGAYVAGTREAVEIVAERFFAPGLGRGVGPTLDTLRYLYAGLHRAPRAVAESLKILDYAARLFALLGYGVSPCAGEPRTDIIQAIALGSAEKLERFARGLQRLLPVNAAARPVPGAVAGYADPVIMAGGAFISGSTLELSCDAPLREPYEVYLQGGLDAMHGVLAVAAAAAEVEQ